MNDLTTNASVLTEDREKIAPLTRHRRLTRTDQWCDDVFYQAVLVGLAAALDAGTS
jgi:hypothetical protein